jgi:RecA/RadA recombinase
MSQAETIAALRSLVAARFPERPRAVGSCLSTGVGSLDEALGGGLRASQITEVVVGVPSSGGQLLLTNLLTSTRSVRQRVALVDAADAFAPESVPADALLHLVWARCRAPSEALSVADILVRDGNYAVGVNNRWRPGSVWPNFLRLITKRT